MAWPCTAPLCASGNPWLLSGQSIGPNVGSPTCSDLTESSPVFCGPNGILSVPKRSCQTIIFGPDTVGGGPQPSAVLPKGGIYTSPTPTSVLFEANTHSCQYQSILAFWDPTATIILNNGAVPCYPIWSCGTGASAVPQPDWYPPKEFPFAAMTMSYQWRTTTPAGAPITSWTTILTEALRSGGVYGSNSHQTFCFMNLRSPGSPAVVLQVRVVYTNTGTVSTNSTIQNETSYLHGRYGYYNYCGPDEVFQTTLDDSGKILANTPALLTDSWVI